MQPSPAQPRRVTFAGLAVVTLATTLVLVALGGAVRATDSGLACPTWPGCFEARDFLPAWHPNVWLEHSHRLVAGLVGLQVAALLVWALLRWRHDRRVLAAAVAAAVLVNVQAALGALVVLRLLQAELVTAHLGTGMLLLGCLGFLVVHVRTRDEPSAARRDLRLGRAAAGVAALVFAQILVGGHTTGIGAGLVYTDFPLMGGAVFPPIGSEQELFHVGHRVLGFLVLAAVGWLAARALRARRTWRAAGLWDQRRHRWLVRLPLWALALTVAQVALGVANLWTRTAPVTVIPHLAVASWLWTTLVCAAVLARRRGPALAHAAAAEGSGAAAAGTTTPQTHRAAAAGRRPMEQTLEQTP